MLHHSCQWANPLLGLKLRDSDRHLCAALLGVEKSATAGVAVGVAVDFESGRECTVSRSRVIRQAAAPRPLPRKRRLPAKQTKKISFQHASSFYTMRTISHAETKVLTTFPDLIGQTDNFVAGASGSSSVILAVWDLSNQDEYYKKGVNTEADARGKPGGGQHTACQGRSSR